MTIEQTLAISHFLNVFQGYSLWFFSRKRVDPRVGLRPSSFSDQPCSVRLYDTIFTKRSHLKSLLHIRLHRLPSNSPIPLPDVRVKMVSFLTCHAVLVSNQFHLHRKALTVHSFIARLQPRTDEIDSRDQMR